MSHVQTSNFSSVFPNIPKEVLDRLESSYNNVKKNFRENRFEPSELNGAKFCEAVFRLLEWHTSKSYTRFGTSIKDFTSAVKRFEQMSTFSDSVRFHIPKILDALYGIRNKRGVGHLGGDVNPNQMDAIFVASACDWIMAELVRIFHQLSTEEAQKLVQDLVTKKIPIIWKIGQSKRVLAVHLSYKDKALGEISLSPLGLTYVEQNIKLEL